MSNLRMIQNTVRDLLQTADTHHAKIDPKLRNSLEVAAEVLTAVGTIAIDGPDLGTAITDALIAGRDVASDPDVARAIIASHITSPAGVAAVRERTTARLWTLLRENLDNLIKPFQAPLESAAEAFAQAHSVLVAANIQSLTDPALATSPLTVAAAGIEARKAQADITAIRGVVDGLLVTVDRTDPTPVGRITRWVDAGNATAARILALGKSPTEWDVIAAGFKISLATPAENAQRRRNAGEAQDHAHREANRDHAQEARAAAMSRSLAM